MVSGFWMPNKAWAGCDVNDPSARVLANYGDSGKNMDDAALCIRTAHLSDAPALRTHLCAVWEKTAITFEYTVPDVEGICRTYARHARRYPYLVAERCGEIVGYAYAGPFGERAAYAWSAEMSIYLREDPAAAGNGRRLYAAR